jgi:xanthine dehydrogenase accessory factor
MSIAWIDDLARVLAGGQDAALVTLVKVVGSAPREAGVSMVVSTGASLGTVGGGHLEFTAIEEARRVLGTDAEPSLKRYALGPSVGQCCGGVVWLLTEHVSAAGARGWREVAAAVRAGAVLSRHMDSAGPGSTWSLEAAGDTRVAFSIDGDDWRLAQSIAYRPRFIALFGAGHVGEAVARALAPLPVELAWIDSREDVFPESRPANVDAVESDAPEKDVARFPPGTMYLVMTHSHDLDFAICEAVLKRGDAAFLGLIGSTSKRARFAARLAQRGIAGSRVEGLTCPIGLAGIAGKAPAMIAVAVAAQIAQILDSAAPMRRSAHVRH